MKCSSCNTYGTRKFCVLCGNLLIKDTAESMEFQQTNDEQQENGEVNISPDDVVIGNTYEELGLINYIQSFRGTQKALLISLILISLLWGSVACFFESFFLEWFVAP